VSAIPVVWEITIEAQVPDASLNEIWIDIKAYIQNKQAAGKVLGASRKKRLIVEELEETI